MMKVVGNRVLVKRLDEPTLTSKTLVIIQQDKEPGMFALVAGVGKGMQWPNGKYRPIEVVEGDLVIIRKYSGAPVTIDGQEFHLVDGDDVLAYDQGRRDAAKITVV